MIASVLCSLLDLDELCKDYPGHRCNNSDDKTFDQFFYSRRHFKAAILYINKVFF